ncbi:hypothetical protein DCC62_29680 [candidate division KSB1 bacterium]|nr:MAG: hypothetical protein DCC62_29680 [candidate division KSB1 bacterium]
MGRAFFYFNGSLMKIFLSLLGIIAWAFGYAPAGPATQADKQEKQKPKTSFMQAISSRAWQFPRDHGQHPKFRTEWWYFTGNLQSEDGRAFGYQFTIFRNALTPAPANRASAWAFRDGYVAHFGITDIAQRKFYCTRRVAACRRQRGLAARFCGRLVGAERGQCLAIASRKRIW